MSSSVANILYSGCISRSVLCHTEKVLLSEGGGVGDCSLNFNKSSLLKDEVD